MDIIERSHSKCRPLWAGVLGALALVACHTESTSSTGKDGKEGKKNSPPVVVDALLAKVTSSPVEVTGAGTLLPLDEVDLKTEASGRIAQLHLPEGHAVAVGTLLAKIDDAPLQAQRAKVLSQVHRYELVAGRRRQELSLKAVSQQDLDLAQADLEAAKADLLLVDAQIRNTEVRAPFPGKVGLRDVSVGQVVAVGQVLGHLTRTRPLRVELSIPEAKAGSLREGATLSFQVLGRLDRFTARVDAVEPRLDQATRTLKIRARYDGAVELQPGASVTITLKEGSQAGIFVPPEALSGDARGAIIYLDKGGLAVARRVNIGIRQADRVEVVSGVGAGDTVLVVGASRLSSGRPVKIARIVPAP